MGKCAKRKTARKNAKCKKRVINKKPPAKLKRPTIIPPKTAFA